MRAARLAGQLDDGLPRGGMAVQTVEPEIDSGLVDLVDACACIEAATERPGAINAETAPVELAADGAGLALGNVTPRAHHYISLHRSIPGGAAACAWSQISTGCNRPLAQAGQALPVLLSWSVPGGVAPRASVYLGITLPLSQVHSGAVPTMYL